MYEKDNDSGQSVVDTMQLVYATSCTGTYHLDPDCPVFVEEQSTLTRDARIGVVEAIIAANYWRVPCVQCAANFGLRLSAMLPTPRSPRSDGRAIPLLNPDDPLDDGGGVPAPYGAPEDASDVRFDVASAAGWGTASYGINPDEHLGEPTDDDHDWRGSSRFVD